MAENTKSHTLIGKTMLAGLTWRDAQGNVTEKNQIFGVIINFDDDIKTMKVDVVDDDIWKLPTFSDTFFEAPRGRYECCMTGEVVVNPDYLMSWQILAPTAERRGRWMPNYYPITEPSKPLDWKFTYEPDVDYNRAQLEERGNQFLDKTVLIGLRHYRKEAGEEHFIRQEQLFGKIVKANHQEGIIARQANGETVQLPPDLALLQPAPCGEYVLQATGQVVINPDYLTTWSIHQSGNSKT
jgi:hypothetical protein